MKRILTTYTALIIDLKSSRAYDVDYRNIIQKHILSITKELNNLFSVSLIKEVDFSGGDEVQGLFSATQAAYLYARLFKMLIFPVAIRVGIGIGEWSVQVENASTTAQDGSAYHNARYAIEHSDDSTEAPILLYSGEENDVFINFALGTSFALTSNHSKYQNELMLLIESLYPITSKDVIDNEKLQLLVPLISSMKNSRLVKEYLLDDILNKKILPEPIEATCDESAFYEKTGRVRGLAIQLSQNLHVTRQSVEKTLKSGNIYAARNSAIVALKFISKFL